MAASSFPSWQAIADRHAFAILHKHAIAAVKARGKNVKVERTILGVFHVHPPGKRGPKTKIMPAMKRDLLNRIDRLQARGATTTGRRLSDARALRLIMLKHYTATFIQQGKTPAEAQRLAKTIVAGPEFRSRKVDVARWRLQFRKPQA